MGVADSVTKLSPNVTMKSHFTILNLERHSALKGESTCATSRVLSFTIMTTPTQVYAHYIIDTGRRQ